VEPFPAATVEVTTEAVVVTLMAPGVMMVLTGWMGATELTDDML
jgi:hypothetical protein